MVSGFVIYFLSDGAEVIRDVSLNLATAFLVVIITVSLVDIYISAKDEKERRERKNSCIRTLRLPLVKIAGFLFYLVKATATERQDEGEYKIADFLRNIDVAQVGELDTTKKAPVVPERTWATFLVQAFDEFTTSIEFFIEKYAVHLDSQIIELAERIATHRFVFHIRNIPLMDRVMREQGLGDVTVPVFQFVAIEVEGKTALGEYLKLVAELVEVVEQADGGEPLVDHQSWNEGVSPSMGSGRIAQQGAAGDS